MEGRVDAVQKQILTYIHDGREVDRVRSAVSKLTVDERRLICTKPLTADGRNVVLLRDAVEANRRDFVRFLVECCVADVDEILLFSSGRQATALSWAVEKKYAKMVRLLLSLHADPNVVDSLNRSALWWACDSAEIGVIQSLVNCGAANPNVADCYGVTPLMKAVQHETMRYVVTKYMLDSGADKAAVDRGGNTAMHYACTIGYRLTRLMLTFPFSQGDLIVNSIGDDCLRLAAIHRKGSQLRLLIAHFRPSPQRRSDLYALLGAQTFDHDWNTTAAYEYWKHALKLAAGICLPRDDVEPIPGLDLREFHDISTLISATHDPLVMEAHAALCRIRILGRQHPESVFQLSVRAQFMMQDDETFDTGLQLYAFVRTSIEDVSCPLTLRHAAVHSQLLLMFTSDSFAGSHRFLSLLNLVQVTSLLWQPGTEHSADMLLASGSVLRTLCSALYYVSFLAAEDEQQRRDLRQVVGDVSAKSSRCGPTNNALHCMLELHALDMGVQQPVESLVNAGLDVNATGFHGQTALHILARTMSLAVSNRQKDSLIALTKFLISRGIDCAAKDADGRTADDYM